jgi:ABC-type nitrate/sulfonate/bicarbonate transport system permease component
LVDLGLARELPEFFAIALSIVLVGALSTQFLLTIQRRVTPWATEITGFGGRRSK